MDEEISNTVQVPSKSKKRSLGREFAASGCSSTFYKNDGSKSGIYLFQFPKSNTDKLRWCNLITRRDSCDGFKVTNSTVLCEKHFADNAIKSNPNSWRLNRGSA